MANTQALSAQTTHRGPSQGSSRRRSGVHTPAAIEIGVLIAIATLLIAGAVATAGPGAAHVRTQRVMTAPGDTLWTLASNHPIAGMTTQQEADMIARMNAMGAAAVAPGHTLLVPADSSSSALAMR